MRGFIFALCLIPSIPSVAAESGIRRVPLLASHAERLVLVMTVALNGTYWFSECKLPLTGTLSTTEQLLSYLNTQDNMCNALSGKIFQAGDEAEAKGIQDRFNQIFSKKLSSQQWLAPAWAYGGIGASTVVAMLFRWDVKARSVFGAIYSAILFLLVTHTTIQHWTEYLETRGVVPLMIENLVGISKGSSGISPDVARTIFLIYRDALIEATK